MGRSITDRDWPRIRYQYEHTDTPAPEICAENRISSTTLNNRARQWGWTRRRQPVPAEGPPLPRLEAPPLGMPQPEAPATTEQIARQLQGAIARVLTAIDAALAGVSAASAPREIERAGRAVAALTRTLHELNGMLIQFPKPEVDENDELFRKELAKLERMAIVNDAYRKGILRDDD